MDTQTLDTILQSIDATLTLYRRGLLTESEKSRSIWDSIYTTDPKETWTIMRDVLPLVADELIVDKYAISQLKNALLENPEKPRTMVLDDFMREADKSLSDDEKFSYHEAYFIMYHVPDYVG